MKLSPDQAAALDNINHWLKHSDKQLFTLDGPAGTGKTTLANYIRQQSDKPVIFAAYTGKAASVLREKGIPDAQTIHSLIYSYQHKSDHRLLGMKQDLETETDPKKLHQLKMDIQAEIRRLNDPAFAQKEGLSLASSLVVIDEYSMLDEGLLNDLLNVCGKVLALGDSFQLPPVYGKTAIVEADYQLTEVHRQALDSPILRAATEVRINRHISLCDWGDFKYIPKYQAQPEDYIQADQMIVARNKTRTAFNTRFRKLKGFNSVLPMTGEKIMCLKNMHESKIFNGQIGLTQQDSTDIDDHTCIVNYEGKNFQTFRGGFFDQFPEPKYQGLCRFDYAYAITCHKSQGSEFDNVLVYKEPPARGTDPARWLYTAITRAKKKLTLVEANDD